jgi:predicted nucleotidyltransferase
MQEYKFMEFVKFFLENPYQEVYLREVAKKLKLSPFAAKKYADRLVKEKILVEEKRANLRYMKLNFDNIFVRYLKISLNLKKIASSGLIEFIREKIKGVSSIVLYGSVARGEDDKKGDLDLLVIGQDKILSCYDFEKKVGKKIEVHVHSWKNWKKQEKENKAYYLDTVTNGIALYGELPVV